MRREIKGIGAGDTADEPLFVSVNIASTLASQVMARSARKMTKTTMPNGPLSSFFCFHLRSACCNHVPLQIGFPSVERRVFWYLLALK